ncbi:glycosyltransferase family 4 protein [Paenibacillus montanisoli]|uniref:Glycosyl transferase family 1 n=1 Tax=Paenibacillus montanisoli TaxID=2081970 RepID=A0A328U5E7_9BACL|nr:glycosyltransferase family 4 protein [Paenibacillus montanisoli]RAP75126.1 glycosyl transferase family 1 [Paenibacillus montanisoli]
MRRYHVVWRGPIKRASGLGIASREYVRALRRSGVRVTVGASRRGNGRPRILIYHYSPNTLNVQQARKQFDYIIMNTVWETTRIPRRWRAPLNKADAVFVPSKQNMRALRSSGVKRPIYIVPHGVNARFFNPRSKKLPVREAKGRFVFVSVFGFQHRKNPEALLRAYWEEFNSSDKVLLLIKTNGYARYENAKWIRSRILAYKRRLGLHRKKTAPVVIMGGKLSSWKLRGIYTRGNAFVLPTRGEGVGLPFLEALASGIPVIATGWGGHMDFLTWRNAFLVPYKLRPPVSSMRLASSISRQFRGLFAEQGQLWAEASIAGLRRRMRAAYRNPKLCRQKGRQGRVVAVRMSWSRAGGMMKRTIERVVRKRR